MAMALVLSQDPVSGSPGQCLIWGEAGLDFLISMVGTLTPLYSLLHWSLMSLQDKEVALKVSDPESSRAVASAPTSLGASLQPTVLDLVPPHWTHGDSKAQGAQASC